MMKHGKKMIAPIIITIVVGMYFLGIAAASFLEPEIPGIIKLCMILIGIGGAGTLVGVCISRIKEIRSGEEDDLSKY